MPDLNILKIVLRQEISARKRYEKQIEEVKDENIVKTLRSLRDSEASHVKQCVEKIKRLDPEFELIESEYELHDGPAIEEDEEPYSIKMVLGLDKLKEEEAIRAYNDFKKQSKDPEVKNMLNSFIKDEEMHSDILSQILEKMG